MNWKRGGLFLVALIILVIDVNAIGLSPAGYEVNFAPNGKYKFEFIVFSSGPVDIYAEGELKEYVKLSRTHMERGGVFTAELNLPEKLPNSGIRKAYIGVMDSESVVGGMMPVVTGVQAAIDVNVPYPGKYLVIGLNVKDVSDDEDAVFIIDAANLGNENLESVKGIIEVYDESELVASVETAEISLKSQENTRLTAKLRGLRSGKYNASAKVYYDGESAYDSRVFRVGKLFVDILEHTKQFQKGAIQRFDINIRSDWNNEINGLFAEVNITNKSGNLQSFRTVSTLLNAFEEKIITGYFDAKGFDIGEYDALISLYYEGEKSFKKSKINIVEVKSRVSFLTISLILIVIIIVILDIWWLWRRREFHKNPFEKSVHGKEPFLEKVSPKRRKRKKLKE